MVVLPVVDLLNGVVVRGIAGRRDEYLPWISPLCGSCDPLEIATALRALCGHSRLYLADLDAILHARPHLDVYLQLEAQGFQLLIDAGIRGPREARDLINRTRAEIILGLETLSTPDQFVSTVIDLPRERIVFSLDLKAGKPLSTAAWPSAPLEIVRQVVATGIRSLIVLDLADVGSANGGRTQELCHDIRREFPQLTLISGGGVRDVSDLRCWASLADALLVASALHDGRLTRADLTC